MHYALAKCGCKSNEYEQLSTISTQKKESLCALSVNITKELLQGPIVVYFFLVCTMQ